MVTGVIKKSKAGKGDPAAVGLAIVDWAPLICQTQCQACSIHDEIRGRRRTGQGWETEAPFSLSLSLESVWGLTQSSSTEHRAKKGEGKVGHFSGFHALRFFRIACLLNLFMWPFQDRTQSCCDIKHNAAPKGKPIYLFDDLYNFSSS